MIATHKIHGKNNLEIAPATPEGSHSWHAIVFATEVSADPADPQDRLFQRGRSGIWRRRFALYIALQCPPFVFTDNRCTWEIRIDPRKAKTLQMNCLEEVFLFLLI